LVAARRRTRRSARCSGFRRGRPARTSRTFSRSSAWIRAGRWRIWRAEAGLLEATV
jgi:hypothetical protein